MSQLSASGGWWEAEVKLVSCFSAHLDLQLALSINGIHQDPPLFQYRPRSVFYRFCTIPSLQVLLSIPNPS